MNEQNISYLDQWFEFRSTRDGHVESFGGKEGFEIEEIEVVIIQEIGQELISQSVQAGLLLKSETPFSVRGSIDHGCIKKWFGIIEPFTNTSILFLIQFHLNWFKWINIQNVVSIIQRWFLIIKWWKSGTIN